MVQQKKREFNFLEIGTTISNLQLYKRFYDIIIMDLLSERTKSVLFIDKSVVFQGADPTICLDQVSCSNTFHPPAASSAFVLALSES